MAISRQTRVETTLKRICAVALRTAENPDEAAAAVAFRDAIEECAANFSRGNLERKSA